MRSHANHMDGHMQITWRVTCKSLGGAHASHVEGTWISPKQNTFAYFGNFYFLQC